MEINSSYPRQIDFEIIELNDSTKDLLSSFECDFSELKDFLVEDAIL